MDASRRKLMIAGVLAPLAPFSLNLKGPLVRIPERLPDVPEPLPPVEAQAIVTDTPMIYTDLPARYVHMGSRFWSIWANERCVPQLRPTLFQYIYMWNSESPYTGESPFKMVGPGVQLFDQHVVAPLKIGFKDDEEAHATFETLQITWPLDQTPTIARLLEGVLVPGMRRFSRYINLLSPNADQLITAAQKVVEPLPHTIPMTATARNVAITSYARRQPNDIWEGIICLPIAFRWKLHREGVGIVE